LLQHLDLGSTDDVSEAAFFIDADVKLGDLVLRTIHRALDTRINGADERIMAMDETHDGDMLLGAPMVRTGDDRKLVFRHREQ